MVEMLNLVEEDKEGVIQFEECLQVEGGWARVTNWKSDDYTETVELDYRAENYRYFLCQGKHGHTLYRNRKGLK